MGQFNFSAGELASQIKKMMQMNVGVLGNSESQDDYIFYYMTLAMWKFAFLVAITRTSEALTVGADGYVTFQRDGQDVEDLYEVVRIYDAANPKKPLIKRTSWEAPSGWWRDSANSRIHINGAGTYIMQYKGYPAKVTGAAQTLEWPSTSFDLLQYETIGKIKESLNDLEGAAAAYKIADGLVAVLAKASVDAYASGGYKPPGMNELQFFKRGG